MEIFTHPETYISLITLIFLEVVLGIDNIVFVSILASKLPPEKRKIGRTIGLSIALIGRLLLLFSISLLTKLTTPLFSIPFTHLEISGKDLVLLAGGLFLIYKSTKEIYENIEEPAEHEEIKTLSNTFVSIICQIILIDIVFSLDSIITAVGLVKDLPIMIIAIIVAVIIMIISSHWISEVLDRHPSLKILALSFLLMIGTMLTAEALHFHVPRGYIYFSLAFALLVEFVNIKSVRD